MNSIWAFARSTAVLALALNLASCAGPTPPPATTPVSELRQPEGGTGYAGKTGHTSQRFSVAAANPLAAQAGYQILRRGGSAIDAAIAVQMVLTLVEPQSSGIGGGTFLLHHDGRKVQAFDGRETAPAAANERLFLRPDGQAMTFETAVVGGLAVGVPGTLPVLEMVHRQHGKLPWAQLFAPAIALAEDGFTVSPRLNQLLARDAHLRKDPIAADYFYDAQGLARPVGFLLKNPELAHVLRQIAVKGAQALMTGDVAQAIVSKVRQHPTNPGQLTLADLANYRAIERDPLCHAHAGLSRLYRICGMPPPSSGAIAIGQILGILANTPANTMALDAGVPGAEWLHLYLEASRLAFADRAAYVADPAFVAAPGGDWLHLLDPAYLLQRSRLIGRSSLVTAPAGQVPSSASQRWYAPMTDQVEYGTSHVSVVDAWGQAVAMTSSIEDAFGARQMVNTSSAAQARKGGFLLNNELTDFSFNPRGTDGMPVANRVEGGKRPRSSMAPTLVFDQNAQLVMTAGSPGGALIITFTAKTLYGVLNWGLPPQQAIDMPNFGSLGGPSLLEEKRFSPTTIQSLQTRGAPLRELALTSGIQAIQKLPDNLSGGADPRREGVVFGD